MIKQGAYGDTIRRTFHLEKAPSIFMTLRPGASFAVTRVLYDNGRLGKTSPIPAEPALLVPVHFQPLVHELWIDGKPIHVDPWPTGALSVVDLEQEPAFSFGGVLDGIQFYLPRKSLAAMAEADDERIIEDFVIPLGTVDTVTYHLGRLMASALENPEQANQLFISGLMSAFYWHLAKRYGNSSIDRAFSNLKCNTLTHIRCCHGKTISTTPA
jgi:AraC family transcriptional regulator